MTKIIVRLRLEGYSEEELVELVRLQILSKDELEQELKERGVDEFTRIKVIRAS